MALLDTDEGKKRLLSVEIPVIERYNADRDEQYKIKLLRHQGSLILSYKLQPAENIYELETKMPAAYPLAPPETRVITPLKKCPHLLEGQQLCLWRQGSSRSANRWDPAKFTVIFAIQAAWRWLACYELWYLSNEWPFPDAK